MARFSPLFSSSSGNSIYIGSARGGILVDVGVSAKRTTAALRGIGVEPEDISAVFITHEHSDHIKGLRVFASSCGAEVYATRGTLNALDKMGELSGKFKVCEIPDEGVEAAGMFVRAFRTPHDCAESCGYTIVTPDGRRVAIATDLGTVTPNVMSAIYGSDLVMLESNHDIDMLKRGPYPYYLKQRILSDHGHLSNDSCSQTALELLEGGTTRFVLGHLSRHNNFPELAFETTKSLFSLEGAKQGSDYLLEVAQDDGRVVTF